VLPFDIDFSFHAGVQIIIERLLCLNKLNSKVL
jgi:hypothetical protein